MKKVYLALCVTLLFTRILNAQNVLPATGTVGIGTASPSSSFNLHVVGPSRYDGIANYGDYYDPNIYGKGIQIVRVANQPDNYFHLAFVRAGQKVAGIGYLQNSSTFAIQNASNNAATTGIFLGADGNVGVNVPVPLFPLDIAGNARVGGNYLYMNGSSASLYADANNIAFFTNGGYIFGNKDNSKNRAIIESDGTLDLYNSANAIAIRFSPSLGNSYINTGSLGIGTTNTGTYKLAVEGTIGARKIKVTTTSWADFVFDADYTLPSLNELEAFTKSHGHLPGIPSVKEIAEQGLDLGDMQKAQMQKIEELTLYMIDQNKKLEAQQQLIKELQSQLSAQEKRLQSLEQKH